MPIRAYRINFPVLIEDVDNPRALAVHDKLSVVVEAPSALEAARLLERAWGERLPLGFTFMTLTSALPLHLWTRIHWTELYVEGGERVHRHLDGVYGGIDRDVGALRFSPIMRVHANGEVREAVSDNVFVIPFDNLTDHRVVEEAHGLLEGVSDVQQRMDVHVSGLFQFVTYDEGGVHLETPTAYLAVTV